jgi:hypothetical protein
MNTSITIAECLAISCLTVIGYAFIKAIYETWFK